MARRRNPSGQDAFEAGKRFRTSGEYSDTGVANARVAKYGFSRWYNNHRPSDLKEVKKSVLLRGWMEGWAAGKRAEKNPAIPRNKWISGKVMITRSGQVKFKKGR